MQQLIQFKMWFMFNADMHDLETRSRIILNTEESQNNIFINTNNLFIPFARSTCGLKSLNQLRDVYGNIIPCSL